MNNYIYKNNGAKEILKIGDSIIFEKMGEEYKQIAKNIDRTYDREEIINLFHDALKKEHDREENSFDDYEETVNEKQKPYKPSDVKYERKQMTCEELYNQLTGYNGDEEPSIILDPDFQRKSVWKGKEESLFIESILLNIPIPSIYVNETKDKKFIVADGRQRLTAIQNFMSNNLKLKGTEYGKGKYEDKYFRTSEKNEGLSSQEIRHLRRFSIDVNVVQVETPDQVKLDIFGRLNSRGVKLNSQELRNSVMSGETRETFIEIENNDVVKRVINNYVNTNRYSHYELYLRYFAFNKYFDDVEIFYEDKLGENQILKYKGNGKGFLDEYMIYLNQTKIKEEEKEEFYKTLEKVEIAFGEYAFRREIRSKENKTVKSRINTLLFIVIMNEYNKISIDSVKNVGDINKKFQIFVNDNLVEYISSATNNIPNIENTKKEVNKYLKEIYER